VKDVCNFLIALEQDRKIQAAKAKEQAIIIAKLMKGRDTNRDKDRKHQESKIKEKIKMIAEVTDCDEAQKKQKTKNFDTEKKENDLLELKKIAKNRLERVKELEKEEEKLDKQHRTKEPSAYKMSYTQLKEWLIIQSNLRLLPILIYLSYLMNSIKGNLRKHFFFGSLVLVK